MTDIPDSAELTDWENTAADALQTGPYDVLRCSGSEISADYYAHGERLQLAVQVIRELMAENSGLIIERDQALKELSNLVLVTSDAIRGIDAAYKKAVI